MQPWFSAFAERIDDGDPYYLACPACDASALPPRTVCPDCGTRSLTERSLSDSATVTAATRIHSTIPAFAGETPYTVVIARFDEGVQLTGQLRDAADVSRGEAVTLGAERHGEEDWLVTFSPNG